MSMKEDLINLSLKSSTKPFTIRDFVIASKFVERSDHKAVAERLQSTRSTRLLHASFGLCTEAAEFQDALKKVFFYGKELDEVNLKEELGDVLWYIAIACDELGIDMSEVMRSNSKKLMKRYEGGFTESKAANRDLPGEREILEHGDREPEKNN